MKRNELDDGRVQSHHSLADEAIERVGGEDAAEELVEDARDNQSEENEE